MAAASDSAITRNPILFSPEQFLDIVHRELHPSQPIRGASFSVQAEVGTPDMGWEADPPSPLGQGTFSTTANSLMSNESNSFCFAEKGLTGRQGGIVRAA